MIAAGSAAEDLMLFIGGGIWLVVLLIIFLNGISPFLCWLALRRIEATMKRVESLLARQAVARRRDTPRH